MDISVVIATYNRREILIGCLEHLERQTYPKDKFEVIIVDDGSTDNTEDAVKKYIKTSNMTIGFFRQENRGAGEARNLGIKESRGAYCFFISDDEYPSENWMQEHVDTHEKNKGVAVLGMIEWYPKIEITGFMKFIAPYGPQFNFNFKDPNNCGYNGFIIGNITLEKKWFDKDLFDSHIGGATVEDIELGYRLEKRGLRIIFNPKAVVYHNHYQEEPSFIKKQYSVGLYWRLLSKMHPEAFKIDMVALLKLIIGKHYYLAFFNKNLYWRLKCGFFYYLGMFDGYKDMNILMKIIYRIVKLSYKFQEMLQKNKIYSNILSKLQG